MNKNQKEILQSQLNSEKRTINELKQVYNQALKDVSKKISELSSRADMEPQNLQTIIYQKQYQEALKGQIEGVLAELQSKEYATVSDYLTRCYQDGYVGVMYDLAGQGIPFILPINQEQVAKAIQTDSKLSKSLYSRMGEDVSVLKTSVRAELSRGIVNGSTWNEMAVKMAASFKSTPFEKAINNTIRIARTEGHRIQNQSALDAQHEAKKKGADIVKQWDSTLDGKTRDTHMKLDGQIREVDEDFEVDGMNASAPGMFGDPAEDCNCRCALLQRAKWNLDESELETLKERAEYFGLDKSKGFEEFKEKYLKVQKSETKLENTARSSNITDIDKKAIYDYMSVKSYVVNEKLRTGTMLTEEESEFVASLDAALDKMPTYEGNLQRSLLFYSDEDVKEFMNRHTIGNKVTYDEYISTTKGETYNPEGQVQIYIQDTKNGKDISALNDGEKEILYKRNSSFLIVNVVIQDGKYFILAVEDNE